MRFFYQLAESILDFHEQKVAKDFLYYKVKPYKYNDYQISQSLGYLYNFAGLDDEIDFLVVHDKGKIFFVVKLPESLGKYFENCFYANFSDAELEIIEDEKLKKLVDAKNRLYIKFSLE